MVRELYRCRTNPQDALEGRGGYLIFAITQVHTGNLAVAGGAS